MEYTQNPNTQVSEITLSHNRLSELDDANTLIQESKIIGECYKIRVLFDTEHLKNDNDYIAIIEDIWLKAFMHTEPALLEEAVFNFILSDKDGYLPKPGQIVELIAKGVMDIKRRRYYENIERMERQLLFEKYGSKE